MQNLVSSGLIVEIILGLVALEAVVLIGYHRLTGKGISPVHILFNLASGAALLLALRAALTDAAWIWIAIFLTAALASHLLDLRQRWRKD